MRLSALRSSSRSLSCFVSTSIGGSILSTKHDWDFRIHAARAALIGDWRELPPLDSGANGAVEYGVAPGSIYYSDGAALFNPCLHTNRYSRILDIGSAGSGNLGINPSLESGQGQLRLHLKAVFRTQDSVGF